MSKHGELEQTVSRRGLLRGSALVGGAVLGATALPRGALAGLRTGPTPAGSFIPGYLLRADDSGRARPTVIVNHGSDAPRTS